MKQTSIRDLLYEPPGPAARKRISVLTWFALAAFAISAALYCATALLIGLAGSLIDKKVRILR